MKTAKRIWTFSLVAFFASTASATDESCQDFLVSRQGSEVAREEVPDSAANLKQAIYWRFLDKATAFLADHLRWPDENEATALLHEVTARTLVKIAGRRAAQESALAESVAHLSVREILAESQSGVMEDFRRHFSDRYTYLRRKMATHYGRAIAQTDLPPRYRTVARAPSERLFYYATIKSKTNGGPIVLNDALRGQFTRDHLLDLVVADRGQSRSGDFPQPLIFPGGFAELTNATRFDYPARFRNYVDGRIVNDARARRTAEALEKANGFVAVSWTAGKPLHQEYLDALLKLVEERDWILLIGPTQQTYEGLPEIFLTHPRIHVVTHTIENRFLKISNHPINPNIENPFNDVKKPGQYRTGQTVVVFHPHQMMEAVPTASNEFLPVTLWSTGSLNEPLGTFSAISQGSRTLANKSFHKMKFLVFEKADSATSFDADGLQNVWHTRPVTFYDDREHDGTVGFIDWSEAFQFRVSPGAEAQFERTAVYPEYVYQGDPHNRISDPRFVDALIRDLGIPADHDFTIVGGDLFDGGAANHHENWRLALLNRKNRTGELSILREMNDVIQSINALQQRFSRARYAHIIANHEDWLARVLDDTPDFQKVVNGDFIDELNFAVKVLRLDPWEYIFKRRQKVLSTLLELFPEKRQEILGRLVPVHDPERIDIIKRGDELVVGPPHRRNALQFHGDKGPNGRRPSPKDHAKAMPEGGGVTGHTHRQAIYGEWMDAGVMAPVVQPYTAGSYSSQGQGFVMIYPNGTKQLIGFNRVTGSFRQRDPRRILPPDRFFGEDRLEVISNDNDRLDRSDAEEFLESEIERLRALTGPQK